MAIQDTIHALSNKIHLYNFHYYTLDAPVVSDAEYDIALRRLHKLEQKYPEHALPNSPTQNVGCPFLTEGFEKITRKTPMLSLQDAFNVDEVFDFFKNSMDVATEELILEEKIDGLGVALIYEHGCLVSASTRGDGLTGEDVTRNVLTIADIPMRVPGDIAYMEVRGEVYMRRSVLEKINSAREKEGLATFVNTRNTASGALKQLDAKVTSERQLSFFAYSLGTHQGFVLSQYTQSKALAYLRALGFKIANNACIKGLTALSTALQEFEQRRESLDYVIDGVVLKVNDLARQKAMGFRSKSPKGAVAFKFAAEQAHTELCDVTWQVGRTGVITPVGELVPVVVGGATVKRATLHNRIELQRKGVLIGHTVVVQRAGDVIPEIVGISPENDDTLDYKKVHVPTQCPVCNAQLDYEETFIRCVNEDCAAQMLNKLVHYVSRSAMNIDGLSEKILQQLMDAGLVHTYTDLYTLRNADLIALDRFSDKRAHNVLSAINKSIETATLPKFLYALGIRGVGEVVASDIVTHFKTLDAIIHATQDQLCAIDGMGPIVAQHVVQYMSVHGQNVAELATLLALRNVVYQETSVSGALQNKTFLFTGKLTLFKRKDAQQLVKDNGGKILSSVSAKLTYLVAGAKAGSKLQKAEALGTVTILTEQEFMDMVSYE